MCIQSTQPTPQLMSLIHKDIHLIISLYTNNMLPNLLTIRYSTTMELVQEVLSNLNLYNIIQKVINYKPNSLSMEHNSILPSA